MIHVLRPRRDRWRGGNDDIRIGASGPEFQVGGKVIAGEGDDLVEAYGYTDLAMGGHGPRQALRTAEWCVSSAVTVSTAFISAQPPCRKIGEIRKTNTVIFRI